MSDVLDLHYELPAELIAQHPAAERATSQLMVVEAGAHSPSAVGPFAETLLANLRADDLVVVNDSRVMHARVPVVRESGGAGELLLLEPVESGEHPTWLAMARPARRLKAATTVRCARDAEQAIGLVERRDDGLWVVSLPVAEPEVPAWLESVGEVPLPPYIEPDGQRPDRYQTVYSQQPGSVAAPTAGLHFDVDLWQRVRDHCQVAQVTLHVGAGTFLPVRGSLDEHTMHQERYCVPAETDVAIRSALDENRRVVSVGTTTTRVLESVYGPSAMALAGRTDLFITPGYRFGCVGALVTNFHLPESTLLALVMAFAGEETTRTAYAEAIERRMRFYSFGDAMFIAGRTHG